MQPTQRIRFYIGLHKPTDTTRPSSKEIRRRRKTAKDILEEMYPGLTYWNARGVWEGESEPTLVAEVFSDLGATVATGVASAVAGALQQDAVGISVEDLTLQFISKGD